MSCMIHSIRKFSVKRSSKNDFEAQRGIKKSRMFACESMSRSLCRLLLDVDSICETHAVISGGDNWRCWDNCPSGCNEVWNNFSCLSHDDHITNQVWLGVSRAWESTWDSVITHDKTHFTHFWRHKQTEYTHRNNESQETGVKMLLYNMAKPEGWGHTHRRISWDILFTASSSRLCLDFEILRVNYSETDCLSSSSFTTNSNLVVSFGEMRERRTGDASNTEKSDEITVICLVVCPGKERKKERKKKEEDAHNLWVTRDMVYESKAKMPCNLFLKSISTKSRGDRVFNFVKWPRGCLSQKKDSNERRNETTTRQDEGRSPSLPETDGLTQLTFIDWWSLSFNHVSSMNFSRNQWKRWWWKRQMDFLDFLHFVLLVLSLPVKWSLVKAVDRIERRTPRTP